MDKIEKLWNQLEKYNLKVSRVEKVMHDLDAEKKMIERKTRTVELIKIGATVVAEVKEKYGKDLLSYDAKNFPTVLEIVKRLRF